MKRLLSFFLLLSIFVSAFLIKSNAASFIVEVGSAEGKVNETVSVPVSLVSIPSEGTAAICFEISYDIKILEYKDFSFSADIPINNKAVVKRSDGLLRITATDGLNSITKDGLLVTLNFTALKEGVCKFKQGATWDFYNISFQPQTVMFDGGSGAVISGIGNSDPEMDTAVTETKSNQPEGSGTEGTVNGDLVNGNNDAQKPENGLEGADLPTETTAKESGTDGNEIGSTQASGAEDTKGETGVGGAIVWARIGLAGIGALTGTYLIIQKHRKK